MGQYWTPINLDKREFIRPHHLGAGLKLWEQLAAHPGTGAALVVLLAAMPEKRGGGDFDLDENWHGSERVISEYPTSPGPMPDAYPVIAKRTIGRWAGDRVLLVGDYAEDQDAALRPGDPPLSAVWGMLLDQGEEPTPEQIALSYQHGALFKDISSDVAAVIEHELGGKFMGDGWREWIEEKP